MESTVQLSPARHLGTAFLEGSPVRCATGQDLEPEPARESVKLAWVAGDWMSKVRTFRGSEQQRLKDGSYEKMRGEHRSLLLSMMSEGDMLVGVWRLMPEMPKMPFTVDDIAATLEGLIDTFVCEHRSGLTAEGKAKILSAFDEP